MRSTLKFLIVLAVSLLVMLVFRALAFTVYAVGGKALEPDFKAGDRVLVNVSLQGKGRVVIPGVSRCDRHDCYFIDHGGIVAEEQIIGRVVAVLYSRRAGTPFWRGYVSDRYLLSR